MQIHRSIRVRARRKHRAPALTQYYVFSVMFMGGKMCEINPVIVWCGKSESFVGTHKGYISTPTPHLIYVWLYNMQRHREYLSLCGDNIQAHTHTSVLERGWCVEGVGKHTSHSMNDYLVEKKRCARGAAAIRTFQSGSWRWWWFCAWGAHDMLWVSWCSTCERRLCVCVCDGIGGKLIRSAGCLRWRPPTPGARRVVFFVGEWAIARGICVGLGWTELSCVFFKYIYEYNGMWQAQFGRMHFQVPAVRTSRAHT